MSQQFIITTRPADDARKDIADLNAAGIKALAAPMLDIIPLTPRPDLPSHLDAVVLTSRHSVQHMDPSLYDLPCYCVGSSTALAAQDKGFKNVISGPGDGAGLVQLMRQDKVKKKTLSHILWPSAVDTGFNIAHALSKEDIQTTRIPVYKAAVTTNWLEEIDHAIRHDQIAAILMHSGRAGAHFTKMMHDHGLGDKKKHITAIVISTRAASLCGAGWRDIKIASTPRRSAMFAAAAEVLNLPPSSFNGDDLDQTL